MALALVEEDHGSQRALEIARDLVMFLRRPGGQAQFSGLLAAQASDHRPIQELQSWIVDHLTEDLSVKVLATRCRMSTRHFARVFAAERGVTPARFVEQTRVEAARVQKLPPAPALAGPTRCAAPSSAPWALHRVIIRHISTAEILNRDILRST